MREQDVQKIKSIIYSCKNVDNHQIVQQWLERICSYHSPKNHIIKNLIELNNSLLEEKAQKEALEA